MHRRGRFDAASAQERAQDCRRFVARGSEPSSRQAEFCCLRQRAVCKTSRAQRKVGVWGRQPPSAKRFVACGSEPSGRQVKCRCPRQRAVCKISRAQRKVGMWGRQAPPAKRFVARGSEPSDRKAVRSRKRECWNGSPRLRLKNLEDGLYSRNHRRARELKAPSRALFQVYVRTH